MTTELAAAAGTLSAVLAGIWIALRLGRPLPMPPKRRQWNAQALREELTQLEQRKDSGELTEAEWQTAQESLSQNLDSELQESPPLQAHRWGLGFRALIAIIPVLIGLGAFWATKGQQHFANPEPETASAQPSLEDMVAALAERLQSQPDDLRGWAMLGRSYTVLQNYSEAAKAFQKANALSGSSNAELLIAEAEAVGMNQDQNLAGRPSELIQAALALEPRHQRGLWYALIAASQVGDTSAQQRYLELLASDPELPDELAALLKSEFGVDVVREPALAIEVTVAIAPGVADALDPNSTVFVYAKALEGPPMPLAVHRQPLSTVKWPLTVRLDDSMAMMPNMSLSSFQAWTLVARISASGDAQPQSGDWMSSIAVTELPGAPVTLSLSQQIP